MCRGVPRKKSPGKCFLTNRLRTTRRSPLWLFISASGRATKIILGSGLSAETALYPRSRHRFSSLKRLIARVKRHAAGRKGKSGKAFLIACFPEGYGFGSAICDRRIFRVDAKGRRAAGNQSRNGKPFYFKARLDFEDRVQSFVASLLTQFWGRVLRVAVVNMPAGGDGGRFCGNGAVKFHKFASRRQFRSSLAAVGGVEQEVDGHRLPRKERGNQPQGVSVVHNAERLGCGIGFFQFGESRAMSGPTVCLAKRTLSTPFWMIISDSAMVAHLNLRMPPSIRRATMAGHL